MKISEQEYQLLRRKHVNTPVSEYDEKLVTQLVHWSELLEDDEFYYQSNVNDELYDWLENGNNPLPNP